MLNKTKRSCVNDYENGKPLRYEPGTQRNRKTDVKRCVNLPHLIKQPAAHFILSDLTELLGKSPRKMVTFHVNMFRYSQPTLLLQAKLQDILLSVEELFGNIQPCPVMRVVCDQAPPSFSKPSYDFCS